MASSVLKLDRSAALQLGAVSVIAGLSVCAGGTLWPLAVSVFGVGAATLGHETVTGLVPNLLSGLFARFSDRQQRARQKAVRVNQNNHVQRGINLAVARCLEAAARSYAPEVVPPDYLTKIATAIRREPLRFEIADETSPINETKITEILSGPIERVLEASPLAPWQWEALLLSLTAELGISNPSRNVEKGVESLCAGFTSALVTELKELGVENDPAWFGIVLRFLMDIRGEVGANSTAIAAVNDSLERHAVTVAGALQALRAEISQRVRTGNATRIESADEHLTYIRAVAEHLRADLPALRAVMDPIGTHGVFRVRVVEREGVRVVETYARHIGVGRAPTNVVQLDDPEVSWEHGLVSFVGSQRVYRHLSHTNPTIHRRRGQEQILRRDRNEEVTLASQDRLTVGSTTLIVEFDLLAGDSGYRTTKKREAGAES